MGFAKTCAKALKAIWSGGSDQNDRLRGQSALGDGVAVPAVRNEGRQGGTRFRELGPGLQGATDCEAGAGALAPRSGGANGWSDAPEAAAVKDGGLSGLSGVRVDGERHGGLGSPSSELLRLEESGPLPTPVPRRLKSKSAPGAEDGDWKVATEWPDGDAGGNRRHRGELKAGRRGRLHSVDQPRAKRRGDGAQGLGMHPHNAKLAAGARRAGQLSAHRTKGSAASRADSERGDRRREGGLAGRESGTRGGKSSAPVREPPPRKMMSGGQGARIAALTAEKRGASVRSGKTPGMAGRGRGGKVATRGGGNLSADRHRCPSRSGAEQRGKRGDVWERLSSSPGDCRSDADRAGEGKGLPGTPMRERGSTGDSDAGEAGLPRWRSARSVSVPAIAAKSGIRGTDQAYGGRARGGGKGKGRRRDPGPVRARSAEPSLVAMGKRGKFELPGTGSDRSKGRQRKVSCRSLNSGNASEGPLPPRPASRLKSSTDEDCSPSTGADTPSGTAAPDCNGPVRDRDAGKGEEGKESCPTVVAAGPPRPAVPFCEDASSQSPDSPCALDSLPCTEISIGSTTVIPSVAPSPVPAASDIGKSAEARPAGLSPLPNCVQLEPPRPKSRAGRRTPDIASASKVKKKPAWSSQWQNEQRREVKGGSGTAPRTELSIKCSNVTRSAGPKIDVREEIGDSGSIQGRKAVSRKPSRRARPYGPGSVGNEVTGASRTSEEFSQVMENGKAQVTIGRGETDSALQAAAMEVDADSANEACCAAALTTHGSFASSTGTGHAAGSQDILRSSSASPCGLEGRQKRLGNIEVVMCTSDGMAEGQVSVVVLPVDVPSSTPAVPLKSRAPSPAVEMEQVQSHTDVPASVPSMETLLDTEPPKGLSKKFRDHFALRDGIAGSGVALLEEKVLDVLEMTGALLKLAKDNPAMQALQNGKSPAPAQLKQHATEMDACMETGMPVEQGAARTPDAPLIGGSSTDDGDGVHATPSLPAAAEGTDPPMEEPREMSESRPGRDSSQVGCASVEEADDRSETETTSSEPELPVAPRGYALWSPPEAEGPPDEANTRDGYNAPLSTAMLTSDADAVRPSLHEDGLQSWAIPQFQGDDVQLSIFKALVGPALKQEGTIQASTDNQMPIEERPTQGGETVQPGLRNLGTHKRREVHKTSQGTSPHADSEYAALLDGEVADCAAGARRVEGDGHSDASRPASSLRPVDAVCGDGARLPPRAQGPVTEAVGDVSQAEWPHVYTVQLPGLDRSDGKAMSATHDDFEFDPPSPRHSDLPKLVGGYEVWSFNPMWQEDRRTPTPSFGEPCLSERSIPSHRDWSPSPAPSSCGRATPTGARRAADGGEGCTEGGGAVEVVGAGGGPNPRGHSSAMSIHGDDPIPAIVQEAAGEKFAVSYVNGKSSRGNLVELVASEANDASGVEAQNGEIVYEKAAESKDEVLSLGAHPHVDPPPEQVVDDLKQETVCPQPIEAKEATTPCGGNAAKNTAEVAPAIAEVIEADGSMLQGKQGKDSTAEADDQAAADLGTISSLSSLAGKKEQVDMHSLIQTTNSTIPKVLKQQPADEISPEEESTGALMEGLKGIQSQGQDPPPCGEEVSPSAKEAAVYAVLEPAKAYEDSVLLDGKEKGIASSEKSPSSEALTDNVPCTEWLTAVGEDATDRQEGKVEPTHCTSEECTPHQPAAICRTTAPGGDACPRNSSPKMYTDVETSVSTSPLSCIPKPTVAGAATGAEVAHLVAVDSVDEVVEAMATAAGEGLVPAAAKPEKEAVAAAFGVPASSKMASSADMEPTLGASNLPVQEMADITPALASAEETQGPGTPHYGNGILDVEGSISAERIAHEVAAGSTEMLQDKEEPDGGNDETLAQELPTTVSQAVAAANSDLQKPHGSPGPQEGASTPQQTIGRTKPVAAGTKNRVLCADMLPQVERPAVDDQAEANVVVQEGATEKDPVEERDTKPLTETHGAKGPVMKAAAEKKNVTKTTTLKKLRSSASSVSKSLGCGCFGGLLVKAGNFTRAS